MKYQKQVSMTGSWVKAGELTSAKAKIVSETAPQSSSFLNKDGSPKSQDVAKVKFEGMNEAVNVSLNRTTINALVDAFGEDSINWQNKTLSVETEKIRVAGKAVTALYLIPEGYKRIDNEEDYAVIIKEGENIEPTINVDEGEGEINPADIPF